jgi:hypothetical protein
VRAFVTFVKEHGVEFLLDCLERNEQQGIVYHHPGSLNGDYDVPQTETALIEMIQYGKTVNPSDSKG